MAALTAGADGVEQVIVFSLVRIVRTGFTILVVLPCVHLDQVVGAAAEGVERVVVVDFDAAKGELHFGGHKVGEDHHGNTSWACVSKERWPSTTAPAMASAAGNFDELARNCGVCIVVAPFSKVCIRPRMSPAE